MGSRARRDAAPGHPGTESRTDASLARPTAPVNAARRGKKNKHLNRSRRSIPTGWPRHTHTARVMLTPLEVLLQDESVGFNQHSGGLGDDGDGRRGATACKNASRNQKAIYNARAAPLELFSRLGATSG